MDSELGTRVGHGTRDGMALGIERELEQSVEIECSVVFKLTRGRGTRVGEELELSVKSNKTCKSSLACF